MSFLMMGLETISFIIPLLLLLEVFIIGLFPTLWHMLHHPRSIHFLSRWRDSFHNAAQPYLLAMSDRLFGGRKRQVIAHAQGRILEVGAGTGATLKYYDKTKVDIVYGVEPNLEALDRLKASVKENGLTEKYQILPFGIENSEKMIESGVTVQSIDTVVCVR